MVKKHLFKRMSSTAKKDHFLPACSQVLVHPCVINHRPYIVYQRGLKEKSPGLFDSLSQHFLAKGYELKEEQRSESRTNKFKNERRKWAPVLFFHQPVS